MSNVAFSAGGAPVDSLALVAVDGVTIVGDGVDTPLSAPSSGIAAAYVLSGSLERSRGIASFVSGGTGIFGFTLSKPPANYLDTVPVPVLTHYGSALSHPAGQIRADVNADGSITVRTFDDSGAAADRDFTLTVTAGLAGAT